MLRKYIRRRLNIFLEILQRFALQNDKGSGEIFQEKGIYNVLRLRRTRFRHRLHLER